ncbi:MAG TPA: hypothetical protein VGH74_04545, partial [Planctomycetaceae bacterium]
MKRPTVLLALLLLPMAGAARGDEFKAGPSPKVGNILHLTASPAFEGAPRDRLMFGVGEEIFLWIERDSWHDVDLRRTGDGQDWQEVPDEMGLIRWAVDTAADVYPTVGEHVLVTCSTFSDEFRAVAFVGDSGTRGRDRPLILSMGDDGALQEKDLGKIQLEEDPRKTLPRGPAPQPETEPEPSLLELLYDLERQTKRVVRTPLDKVERQGKELLARFDDAESQGQIYFRLAKIAAECGQIEPRKTIEFAKA